MSNQKLTVTPDTIARTVFLAVTLLNQILLMFDMAPFDLDESAIYTLVSTIATVVSAVLAWWKNNSFTQPALQADAELSKLKQ